jgi:hypothetical protein
MPSGITGCRVEVAEGSGADSRSSRVDFSRLGSLLPELDWNAELGAHELIDAYRGLDLTLEDFEGDKYVRLRRLRTLLDAALLDARLRWREPAVQSPDPAASRTA